MSARHALALAVVLAVSLAGVGYALLGAVAAAVFAVSLGGSLVAWRLTTYGRPADPRPIVVPYLLAVILSVVHVGEEYVTGFWTVLSWITGWPVLEERFVLVAAIAGPVLWLSGLVLLYLRTEIGSWLAWAFVRTVSELAHFVSPFVARRPFGYFSGLYTAALPLVPAAVVGVRLVRSGRARRETGRPASDDGGTAG